MVRVILTKIDALFSDHNRKRENKRTCLNRNEGKEEEEEEGG